MYANPDTLFKGKMRGCLCIPALRLTSSGKTSDYCVPTALVVSVKKLLFVTSTLNVGAFGVNIVRIGYIVAENHGNNTCFETISLWRHSTKFKPTAILINYS